MEKGAQQKIKLLLLWQLLQQESDETHPLRTGEILQYLTSKNISCDRRTLAKDIAHLNEWGFEVMRLQCGHGKGYYVEDRGFSLPELRVLMDAVQASDFITEKKTEDLTHKIASLGGNHRAELLKRNFIPYNRHKHSNETVYYSVDTIEKAISEGCKISFRYFSLNEKRERIYHREKSRYEVEPVSLVLMRDKYYLTAVSPHREGLSVYRVDRMEDVQQEAEKISLGTTDLRTSVPDFVGKAFKMFAGESQNITLEFHEDLIGAIFDRFGEKTRILRIAPQTCRTTVMVQTSPTFWGWLFQFGDKMVVTAPQKVVEEAKQYISNLPYFKEELK